MNIIEILSETKTEDVKTPTRNFRKYYQEAELLLPDGTRSSVEIVPGKDSEYPRGIYTIDTEQSFEVNEFGRIVPSKYVRLIPLKDSSARVNEILEKHGLKSGHNQLFGKGMPFSQLRPLDVPRSNSEEPRQHVGHH